MYIMHNISATSSHPAGSTYANVDRETVYNWIFGLTPEPLVPITSTGNTQHPKSSWIEFYGPFSTETEAFDYPPASTPPAGAPIPSLQTLLWRGDFLKTFWNSDTGFRVPFGFYKTISTTGPALINFSTDWPQHNNVFEVNANGVRFNMAPQIQLPLPTEMLGGKDYTPPPLYRFGLTVGHMNPGNPSLPMLAAVNWFSAAAAAQVANTHWAYHGALSVGTKLYHTSGGIPNFNDFWYKIAESQISTDEGRILQLHKSWPDGPGIPTITVNELW
jgi:hypothetical protein